MSKRLLSERETKENSTRKKKRLKTFLIHHKSFYLHPNYQFREEIQTSIQITLRVAKRRGSKSNMHSQYPMPSYFQIWSKYTRFLLFRPRLESLHIRNGMTIVLDVNTMTGFKDTLQKASHHSKIKFRL